MGLKANATGFGNELKDSCFWQFSSPSSIWTPTFTSPYQQFVKLSGGVNQPSRISANLLSGQIGIAFPAGFQVKLTDSATPYLTWPDGSVAPGVPTPKANWFLLSWDRAQPPILICFGLGQLHSLEVTKAPTGWLLEAEKGFSGWIRISAPFGDKAIQTDTAATLGVMANEFAKNSAFWLAEPAALRGIRQVPYKDGILGDWEFTGNAIVPAPVVLAQDNGDPLVVTTSFIRTGYSTDDGPLLLSTEPSLKVRFPLNLRLEGRPVRQLPASNSPTPASYSLLFGDGGNPLRQTVNQQVAALFSAAKMTTEPFTQDQILYDSAGTGFDRNANLGLLTQFAGVQSPENPFLVGQSWAQDWLTWLPTLPNGQQDQVLSACITGSAAAGLSNAPAIQLFGATQAAGLWSHWQDIPSATNPDELSLFVKLFKVRYVHAGVVKPYQPIPWISDFFDSPARVLSGQRMWLTSTPEGFRINWEPDGDQSRIRLWIKNGYEAEFAGLPIKTVEYNDQGRYFSFQISGAQSGDLILKKVNSPPN